MEKSVKYNFQYSNGLKEFDYICGVNKLFNEEESIYCYHENLNRESYKGVYEYATFLYKWKYLPHPTTFILFGRNKLKSYRAYYSKISLTWYGSTINTEKGSPYFKDSIK